MSTRTQALVMSILFVAVAWAGPGAAGTENHRAFPRDAGYVNVRDVGACGDGVHDDTDAIQKAMDSVAGPKTMGWVYFPKGTYLVSRQLRFQRPNANPKTGEVKEIPSAFLTLIGESREESIIQLADRSPIFGKDKLDLYTLNPRDPKHAIAVIRTNADRGNSAVAIQNYIRNLTIDVGVGNPGAIGIIYTANNQGAISDVTIRSSDPQGAGRVGLAMMYVEPGPCLIQRVTIEGFDHGIRTKTESFNGTFEDITLRHQRLAGIYNEQYPMSIRHLHSDNKVPAIINDKSESRASAQRLENLKAQGRGLPQTEYAGFVTLIDSELVGGDPAQPAIQNEAFLFARNVKVQGYGKAIASRTGGEVQGNFIEEYTSHPPVTLFDSPPKSLNLPVKDTPDTFHTNDFSQWANVLSFTKGIKPVAQRPAVAQEQPDAKEADAKEAKEADDGDGQGEDDGNNALEDHTAAIQAALNSGKPIVYFPKLASGVKYGISRTLHVPASVRTIYGMSNKFDILDGGDFDVPYSYVPVWVFEGQTDVPVTIQDYASSRFSSRPITRHAAMMVEHASRRPLVLKSFQPNFAYRNRPNCGPLFIEDVVGSDFRFLHPQEVFARQLDTEGKFDRIINNGARLWILGYKVEGMRHLIQTMGGGQTEVLGGFIFPAAGVPGMVPAFSVDDHSAFSGGFNFHRRGMDIDKDYYVELQVTRDGVTRQFTRPMADRLEQTYGPATVIPLMTAYATRDYHPQPLALDRNAPSEPPTHLPDGWIVSNIGAVDNLGEGSRVHDRLWMMSGGSLRGDTAVDTAASIGDKSDAMQFTHHPVSGDADLSAVLLRGPVLRDREMSGLMFRANLDPNAPMVFAGFSNRKRPSARGGEKDAKRIVLLVRDRAGAQVREIAAVPFEQLPLSLRLKRDGNKVVAQFGPDGKTWRTLGEANWPADADLHAGLAISSGQSGPADAVFGDVRLYASDKEIYAPEKSGLPPGWYAGDVPGDRPIYFAKPGATTVNGDSFTLTGSGFFPQQFGRRHFFHLAHQLIAGDCTLVARVMLPADAQKGSLAGLMIIGQVADTWWERPVPRIHMTPLTALLASASNGIIFKYKKGARTKLDGPKPDGKPVNPVWLKLERRGQTLSGFRSADGKTWQPFGEQELKHLPEEAFVGLFTTSGAIDQQVTVTFEQVRLTRP